MLPFLWFLIPDNNLTWHAMAYTLCSATQFAGDLLCLYFVAGYGEWGYH